MSERDGSSQRKAEAYSRYASGVQSLDETVRQIYEEEPPLGWATCAAGCLGLVLAVGLGIALAIALARGLGL